MKFLCLDCDDVMEFAERQLPGDGTFAVVYTCGSCGREMAMLANPMETQLVSGMGVKIGGRELPEQPMELTRTRLAEGREDAFEEAEFVPDTAPEGDDEPTVTDGPDSGDDATSAARHDAAGATASGSSPRDRDPGLDPGAPSPGGPTVEWSPDAVKRLQKVPRFVRGMVKRIYTDYARERGIERMTPETMDRARSDLGLEGM